MKIVNHLPIPDLKLIEPNVYNDARGFFYESYNKKKFNELIGKDINFIQDNHSRSSKGVLRGLHYQLSPFEQGKLVRVVYGEVWDVAVDIRKNSNTFGKWVCELLSAENRRQLWIPEGFAHGFYVISNYAELNYKVNKPYSKDHEKTIHWRNNDFGIEWPLIKGLDVLLSNKDDF